MKISVLFVILVFINGVLIIESVSVLVYENDTVTLHTNTELLTNDTIEWRFGDEQDRIAKINGAADSLKIYDDALEGKFRDKLKLNTKTGDLTITNITTQHTGLCTVYIKREKVTKTMNFSVDVSGDKMKMVMVGDSVILVKNCIKKPGDEMMMCRIRHNNSPVAEIIRNGKNITYDIHDERYTDGLKVDDQTGDLNITTHLSGSYEVNITVGSKIYTIHRSFNVTAKEVEPAGLSPGAISGICGAVCVLLLLLLAVILYKYFYKKNGVYFSEIT
ncbi:uncharacterized protein [Misgurnus anguillicaudatus]|uniref:uncharacterized protein isoform X2 n=1 Tax=Misgurnus anguillicaudatus TaxID=75329 RepID=UPI003CCF943F